MKTQEVLSKISVSTIKDEVDLSIERAKEIREGNLKALVTRSPRLNKMLNGGISFGDLIVLGGRPGHGKSAISLMFINDFCTLPENQELMENTKIVFWNFEMSAEEQLLRLVSSKMKLSYEVLMEIQANIEDDRFDELIDHLISFTKYPLLFVNDSCSGNDLYALNKNLCNAGYKVINIVDHTRLVSGEGTEEDKITKFANKCNKACKDFKSSFILLSQLNKNIDSSERKQMAEDSGLPYPYPTQYDLFGADGLAQAAHKIIILVNVFNFTNRQDISYGDKKRGGVTKILNTCGEDPVIGDWNLIDFHCVKNRRGKIGMTSLKMNLITTEFIV